MSINSPKLIKIFPENEKLLLNDSSLLLFVELNFAQMSNYVEI